MRNNGQNKEWNEPNKADIWWNHVSGPKAYLNEITQSIQDGNCVVLNQSDIDDALLEILQEKIMNDNSTYIFDSFQVSEYANESEFLDAFIGRLAPEFMRGFTSPYQKLIESGVIMQHIVFLDMSEKTDWAIKVIKEFSALSSLGNGIFICLSPSLEYFEGIKRLKRISLKQYVSVYNVQYFALQCLGNFETRDSKGMYIAQLAAKLCGVSGMFCAQLATASLYSDPMDQCINLPKDKIEHAIWETQIQIFLPIIEEIRRYLILKYEYKIQNLLPKTDEFNNKITNAIEVELRHLQYYGRTKDCTFFDRADDEWFKAAYNARNELTHLHVLGREVMDFLFDIEYELGCKK